MAIQTSIAGAATLHADVIPVSPGLAVLALLTCVVIAVIYAYQPPFPQTMVFSFLPWIVTGSVLSVLATGGEYPWYLEPVLTGPGAYLTAIFVPGLAWVVMLNLSVSRQGLPAYHHYIGTMGVGTMVILLSVLIVHIGSSHLSRLLILLVIPVIALLATGIISLTIVSWSPDFLDYTMVTGAFVIFGALVNGIATTTNVALRGADAHTAFSAVVRDVVATAAPAGIAGVDVTHLWVWLFLLANVGIGIHVATQLAPYADRSPRAVNAMLGMVGILGFTLGFNRLLTLVVG